MGQPGARTNGPLKSGLTRLSGALRVPCCIRPRRLREFEIGANILWEGRLRSGVPVVPGPSRKKLAQQLLMSLWLPGKS